MVIQILNFTHATQINYPLAFLKAKLIPSCSCASICASNLTTGAAQHWPVNGSLLKCFVALRPGANSLRLSCPHNAVDLSLTFSPSPRRTRVRLLYITARDSDGRFQAPGDEDNSPDSAVRRIRLAALLLQSLTAEMLSDAGLGRRTFQLVLDENRRPAVDRFECAGPAAEMRRMSGDQLWTSIAKQLVASYSGELDTVKWMGFMAFTRYEGGRGPPPRSHQEVMDRTRGHCALGGGGLALFGTGNLYAWAESLEELPRRLHDSRRVDRRWFMDDSAFRGTLWSNYATGLGAVLHELGHVFDLSHTQAGLMQRGGDDLNLALSYPPRDAGSCRECAGRPPDREAFRAPPGARPLEAARGATAGRYLQIESRFVLVHPLTLREAAPGRASDRPMRAHQPLRAAAPNGVNGTSPAEALEFGRCESLFHNGRASFARSSAVLLAFHRWFRDDEASSDFCLRISRTELLADKGLRTVEFVADGVVAGHWEYTNDPPPTLVPLGTSALRQICPNVECLIVVAEDDEGHLYKARVRIDQFGESPVLSPV